MVKIIVEASQHRNERHEHYPRRLRPVDEQRKGTNASSSRSQAIQ